MVESLYRREGRRFVKLPESGVVKPSAEEKETMKWVRETQPKGYKEKLLVISDMQLLQETNEPAVGALLKYMEDQADTFTHVVLNGDIIDFHQQSSFSSDNQLGDSVTVDEQVAGRWFIDWMEEHFPQAEKVFMMGNHENRYKNMYENTNNGVKQYLRPFKEVFGLENWDVKEYGRGQNYDWHGRKFVHGTRAGQKTNIAKLVMEDSWRSTTQGHATTNRMWEFVDADGNSFTTFVHSGFSKTAEYDKSGFNKPSNGFGVYYWNEVNGKGFESAYQVIFGQTSPRFISPEGNLYDGEGFDLREKIGLGKVDRGVVWEAKK